VHRDGVERLDRPEAIEVDRRIFLLDLSATTGTGPPPALGPPRLPEVPAVAVDPV
jgi:hypothetical protein